MLPTKLLTKKFFYMIRMISVVVLHQWPFVYDMYIKGKMRLVYMKELILFSCELVQIAIRMIHKEHFLIICYSIYICLLWKYLWLTVGPGTVIVIILFFCGNIYGWLYHDSDYMFLLNGQKSEP